MNHDAGKMYLEYFAKELLETLVPEKYADIRNDESPDLRMGNDYGIEVTEAMSDNQGQAIGIFSRIHGKKIAQVDPRHIRTLDRIRAKIFVTSQGIIYGLHLHNARNGFSCDDMVSAYCKKKELQFGTKHTDLFVYTTHIQSDKCIGRDKIMEYFESLNDDLDNPFDHLIVFEEPTLYLYDFLQKTMLLRRGTKEQITSCKLAADSYSDWSKRYS
ncbi:MAG: hypothetical protein J5898_07910 [Lachnospiraceae bacterium]|nr:hypothetical protein [Lachnospiraceae bacterium]